MVLKQLQKCCSTLTSSCSVCPLKASTSKWSEYLVQNSASFSSSINRRMVKTFPFKWRKNCSSKLTSLLIVFQNCPHKMCDQFLFSFSNAFFTVMINGGHCNLLCIYLIAIYEEGTLEGPIYNVTTSYPSWHLATDFLCGASAIFLKLAWVLITARE